nr:glucose-6-phosphate 1-dehydrogenase (EC 1.1.1.49), endoplasmic reticulum - rabbit [Oryctolagus cuniculus]
QELQGHVSVILLGATGDLAKKYLWQGLFQLFLDEAGKGHSFSFHGAALTAPKQGQELMAKALESLSCPRDMAPSLCAELQAQFLRLSRYRQLKTAEDYQALGRDIEAQVQQEGLREAGRMFYFSVPPFAYADIARNINSSCRPGPGAWLRVVLEKPFGHDHLSAQQLATELGSFFQEEEMYRVDHYLGKQAVAQILPFRDQNRRALDSLWNRHHVERVEIIMKETVDAEGRTSFYEEYGVIRDTLQNHLTEILTLVAMELPANVSCSEAVLRHKLQAFRALRRLQRGSAVVGQYQTYSEQVRGELRKPAGSPSLTPTFAGVLVHVDNLRVPLSDPESNFQGLQAHLLQHVRVPYYNIHPMPVNLHQRLCAEEDRGAQAAYASEISALVTWCSFDEVLQGMGTDGHTASLFPQSPTGLDGEQLVVLTESPSRPHQQRMEGVPFILMSGKALDERVGYVRVLFKNQAFCAQSEKHWAPAQSRCLPRCIIFYIGHGELGHPAVVVSRNLFRPFLPAQSWREVEDRPGLQLFGRPLSDFYAFSPVKERDAYSILLSHIFHARKESFVPTEHLLASWVFWTPLLESLAREVPRLYPGGADSGRLLDFEFSGSHLSFSLGQPEQLVPGPGSTPRPSDFQVLGAKYRESPLISAWPDELISKLASDIEAAAVQAVRRVGTFHLALSGGSSPIALFQQLASGHYGFPRMSLSLPLINRAKKVAVLVMGRTKRDITLLVSRVGREPKNWPISGVLPTSGQLVWYMDYEAFLG